MAIILPHIEDSGLTQYIPPKGEFETFTNDEHYEQMARYWGLSNKKQTKKEFWYKGKDYQRIVTIEGYEMYGVTAEYHTLVIRFRDGQLSCINPDYLKDMQSSNFGKESVPNKEGEDVKEPAVLKTVKATKNVEPKKKEVKEEKLKKKESKPNYVLPEEKVHFNAIVKQFAYSYNHFNEENEEVVILEQVEVHIEPPITIDLAWCSHSKTLKKYELQPGDKLEFDGKIVKKTLPKGKEVEDEAYVLDEKVMYKVNNPSKIQKN